jgi:hypothetical protein
MRLASTFDSLVLWFFASANPDSVRSDFYASIVSALRGGDNRSEELYGDCPLRAGLWEKKSQIGIVRRFFSYGFIIFILNLVER